MQWLREHFELDRGGGDHNLRPMEGLRGGAVFLVFLVHYVSLIAPWIDAKSTAWSVAEFLRTIGHTGVDLFFVLSGYLIYGALIVRPRPMVPYFRRRIMRLYPAFTVVFFVYIMLSILFPFENKVSNGPWQGFVYLLENFLLLPGIFPIEPMITVTWSLSYEAFYYIAIPIIIGTFALRKWPSSRRILFFVVIGIVLAALHEQLGQRTRLVMFLAGIVLWEHRELGGLRTPSEAAGVVAVLAGFAVVNLPLSLGLRYGLLAVAFHLFCFASLAPNGRGLLNRALCWTPLRWLGNMSYSYYLLHGLALKAAFRALARFLPPTHGLGGFTFGAGMAPLFVLTLVPTALLFLAVERPMSLAPRRHK